MVALINSLPGVTKNGTLLLRPASLACSAIEATRDISSYDELVQDPMSAEERVVGYLFDARKAGKVDRGVERSGVKGPFRWGSSVERSYASANIEWGNLRSR